MVPIGRLGNRSIVLHGFTWWCVVSLSVVGPFAVPPCQGADVPLPLELEINVWPEQEDQSTDDFVTWAPIGCRIRARQDFGDGTFRFVLKNRDTDADHPRGQVVFAKYSERWWDPTFAGMQDSIELEIPANRDSVAFVIAGKFGSPSSLVNDAAIVAMHESGTRIGEKELTVRIRKDAKDLSDDERQTLLRAISMAQQGDLYDVYAIHQRRSDHYSRDGHLIYERALLLAFERLLQHYEPLASIPFVSFADDNTDSLDAVFDVDFLGKAPPSSLVLSEVEYSQANPLNGSRTLKRYSESYLPQVLQRRPCDEPEDDYRQYNFQEQELCEHALLWKWGTLNRAHRDPAFLVVKCSADRAYAQWQACQRRFEPDELSYWPTGRSSSTTAETFGHRAEDPILFWYAGASLALTFPEAHHGPLGPSSHPLVVDMLDYLGRRTVQDLAPTPNNAGLGYSYIDIPFYEADDDDH